MPNVVANIVNGVQSYLRVVRSYLRSKPLTAVILHSWDWESDNTASVRILFTLEPLFRDNPLFLLRMAGRFRDSDFNDTPGSEHERVLQDILIANRDRPTNLVREIPPQITDGVTMFVARAYVARSEVFKGFDIWNPDHRLIPCRFDPASDGPVFVSKYSARLMRSRYPAIIKELGAEAQPVTAARIMANRELYERGKRDLPSMVIFSLDRRMTGDRLFELAVRMQKLRRNDPANPDEVTVRALLDDMRERIYKRDQLPTGFTGGPIVYTADLFIRRACLPLGYLRVDDDHLYPCIAQPGSEGALEMLMPDKRA